jgi:hypothetical protein
VKLRGGSLRFSRGSESFAACDVAREASVGREVLCKGVVFMSMVYLGICGSFLIGRVVILRWGEGEGESPLGDGNCVRTVLGIVD